MTFNTLYAIPYNLTPSRSHFSVFGSNLNRLNTCEEINNKIWSLTYKLNYSAISEVYGGLQALISINLSNPETFFASDPTCCIFHFQILNTYTYTHTEEFLRMLWERTFGAVEPAILIFPQHITIARMFSCGHIWSSKGLSFTFIVPAAARALTWVHISSH